MSELTTTILVIEDDRQIRRVVQGYLEQAGYRVLTAADGDTGLALAQHEKPALIVLDLMLPGLDGWEITRRLRQSRDPAVASVHIIMLTARVEESRPRARDSPWAPTTMWSSPSARANWWRVSRLRCAASSGCPPLRRRRCSRRAGCGSTRPTARRRWTVRRGPDRRRV